VGGKLITRMNLGGGIEKASEKNPEQGLYQIELRRLIQRTRRNPESLKREGKEGVGSLANADLT